MYHAFYGCCTFGPRIHLRKGSSVGDVSDNGSDECSSDHPFCLVFESQIRPEWSVRAAKLKDVDALGVIFPQKRMCRNITNELQQEYAGYGSANMVKRGKSATRCTSAHSMGSMPLERLNTSKIKLTVDDHRRCLGAGFVVWRRVVSISRICWARLFLHRAVLAVVTHPE